MKIIEKEFSKLFLKVYFFIFLISFSGLISRDSRVSIIIIFGFILLLDIFKILRFKKIYTSEFLLTYFLIFVLIIFHVLLFYELNYIFIPKIIVFFFICITIYQISKNMDVSLAFFHRFEKYFNKIIIMLLLLDILFSFNFITRKETYYMGISYVLLFYLAVFSICKKNKNKIHYLKILYIIIFILRYGSRGAILVYLVLIFCYLLNNLYFNRKYKYLLLNMIIFIGGCYIYFKTNFIRLVFQKIADLGIKSRTIELFQQKEIHLSGRGPIYENVYNSILENPISIKGIFSDFLVTGVNDYSHNIVLELLYQFGIILGGIFLILILFIFSIFRKQKTIQDNLIFIFAIVSVVHLMVSSTLWLNIDFWAWIGLCLKQQNFLKNNIDKKFKR